MHVASDHTFYTACNDIDAIIKPITCLGVNYFTYMRSYHDGARLYLQNNFRALDVYLKDDHYLSGNTECKPENYKEQATLWSTMPNQKTISTCARSQGFDHGIYIFQPQDTYLECFSFATQSGNDRIINIYLSKMDMLTRFKEYFREKAAPIIKQAEKQKFVLPFNSNLNIGHYLINSDLNHKLAFADPQITKLLSDRQIECCMLLMEGKTAKEIATLLGLSVRTVEYYLNIVKSKLNCDNKIELVMKLAYIFNMRQ